MIDTDFYEYIFPLVILLFIRRAFMVHWGFANLHAPQSSLSSSKVLLISRLLVPQPASPSCATPAQQPIPPSGPSTSSCGGTGTRERVVPRELAIDKERVLQRALGTSAAEVLQLHHADLAVAVGQVRDGHVLVVDLFEGAERQVEHAERADGELVWTGLRGPVVDDVVV